TQILFFNELRIQNDLKHIFHAKLGLIMEHHIKRGAIKKKPRPIYIDKHLPDRSMASCKQCRNQ
ncbi:MAG: hypothetical protein Q8J62_03900, partial [Candidatus Cloacimonadaceae bacterium]|nr:hypothetical protein [Candidatus Cloacimonadaceae bacterium]